MFFYDVSSFVPINNFKCLKYEQTRVGNCWAVVSQPTGKFNPAKIAPCCNSKVQIETDPTFRVVRFQLT